MGGAFLRTMPKRCAGTAKLPRRVRPGHSTTLGSCTQTAGAEAVKWYRLAAEQGFARAQHNLGLMYANGTGVPQDDVLAYAWLNLAVEQGNELASENKDKLWTRMTANQIARAQELSATLFDRINFASEDPEAKTGVMHGSASERQQ